MILFAFELFATVYASRWKLDFTFVSCFAACASNFPKYASDNGLIVPNGSYAIIASHCVQCSCGPGNRK